MRLRATGDVDGREGTDHQNKTALVHDPAFAICAPQSTRSKGHGLPRAPRRELCGGWTFNDLLRHVVYLGEREDKPAREVVRPVPNAWPETRRASLSKRLRVRCDAAPQVARGVEAARSDR